MNQKEILFKNENRLGNEPSHKLFETISIKPRGKVDVPRDFLNYEIIIAKENITQDVDMIEILQDTLGAYLQDLTL
jgi:CRISPR-associated protein Csd2